MATAALDMLDLSRFEYQDGVHFISPPQAFDGGEEQYDQNIGGALGADLLRGGRGAWQLASHHGRSRIATVLEIGAGGGTCTLGLVAAAPERTRFLVTDTSPRFLRMVAGKLGGAGLGQGRVQFATLAGEDLAQMPPASVDLIVIASALHHVDDWRQFLRDAVRTLTADGLLVIQEPCREGNLMMAMALDVALSPLWPVQARLAPEDSNRIQRCRDSIFFLANSHIRKVGEDKHSFLASELAAAGSAAGFAQSHFYSNFHFVDLVDSDFSDRQGRCSLVGYLDSFMEHHHRISPDGLSKLRQHLFPLLQGVDNAFMAGDGAPLLGCMAFCK
jgi:ubiquinone/menaquinone biosynthesis C-methylase UbiE